jgi:hypothetical protein
MSKIDLIIDALENSKPINNQSSIPFDKHLKALAAARELKALKPVMVLSTGTKLYALDEETK